MFIYSTKVVSQTPTDFPFVVQTYSSKQGLTQNQVLFFAECEKGIYLSTMNDVLLFDGNSFSPANEKSRALAQNNLYYHPVKKTLYGFNQKESNYCIAPIYQKIGNELYTAIHYQENIYTTIDNSGTIKIWNYNHTLLKTYTTKITNSNAICNTTNYIYISDDKSVYSYNKNKGTIHQLFSGYYSKIKINSFNNSVYAIGESVYKIDGTSIQKIEIPFSDNKYFRAIEFIQENEFFISSNNGLFYAMNDKIQLLPNITSISSNSYYGIHYSKEEGCVFVGTESSGFIILNKKRVKTYLLDGIENGSQSNTSIVKDKSGTIYSAINKGKIMQIKNGKASLYTNMNKHVHSLNFIDNKLYAGTWGEGIFILQQNKVIDSINVDGFKSNGTYFTYKDKSNKLWIGTTHGLYIKNNNEKQPVKTAVSEKAISIYQLKNGNLLIGGEQTVYFFNTNGKLIKKITSEDGLKCKEVRCFYEDENKTLWIGTYEGGLYYYRNGKLTSVNKIQNCQLNKDVFTLAKHKNGLIYMSSNNGLWAVNETSLQDFCSKRINYLIPFYYGENSGIINNEFNGGFQNNHLINNNLIYFPSIFGLIEFNTLPNPTKRNVKPYLKNVVLNDTLITTNNVFKRTTHTIAFNFYIKNFLLENNIHYQYQLIHDGEKNPWSIPQKDNHLTLKMLEHGYYTINIRVIDGHNHVQPTQMSYSFEILPYFYETLWFKILLLSLFVVSIILIFSVFYRNLKKKELIKNQISELKLNAIHSKLNPHFIFNTLNSVMYLMEIDKQDEAQKLIEDFSKLLRQFLNASDDSFVPLEEELRIIDLYLSIQKNRYNFDYEITYAQNMANVLIPSLIIQPFVENSLVHGIAHSDKRGMIHVVVYSFENKIVIKIEDNGIGREKANEINKSRATHVSIGTKLVDEKISILERNYNKKIHLKYIDINTNNTTGTLVIIEIMLHD